MIKIETLLERIKIKKINSLNVIHIKNIYGSELSVENKKILLKYLGNFKKQSIELTTKAIILFSIWHPDEAIYEARKKGVFRYKAYGFKSNSALDIIETLLDLRNLLNFNQSSLEFITNKKEMCWLFDSYSYLENKIVSLIREKHSQRRVSKIDGIFYENALFKELLAFVDISFYNYHVREHNNNLNIIESYSIEEITESVSYLIFLYDKFIGIREDINYTVDSDYILSKDIQEMILLGCKVIQIQEFELLVDYFDYRVKYDGKKCIFFDPSRILEKSIRLAYIKSNMQNAILSWKLNEVSVGHQSIENLGDMISDELFDQIFEDLGGGRLSRYRFRLETAMLADINERADNGWFNEEADTLTHIAKELNMTIDETINKKITLSSTIGDVILFQRYFMLLNAIISKRLFMDKDKHKIINSLIPTMKLEILQQILSIFLGSFKKAEELLCLFTYNKNYKLDLQYTPFIQRGNNILFPNNLLTKSRLVRNVIAHSHLIKNQIVNDDFGLEPLVTLCANKFRELGCTVVENYKYTYKRRQGEVDLIVILGENIILIECKAPLTPINNFELRSSFDHIRKAEKQLDSSLLAFSDRSFINQFLKRYNIQKMNYNLKTCIVFGSRLFTGYNGLRHSIRNIYELDMFLSNGIIMSHNKSLRLWRQDTPTEEEILNFISNECVFYELAFNSMEESYLTLKVKDREIIFETYGLNMVKLLQAYDEEYISVDA